MKRTLLTALLAFPLLSAVAAERYTESFGAPEGGLPAGWAASTTGGEPIAEVRALDGARVSHALLIERPGPQATNATVYLTGEAGAPSGGKIADFSLSVTFRIAESKPGNSSSRGVFFRASALSYNKSKGYYVAVHRNGAQRGVVIYRNPKSHTQNGDEIATASFSKNLEADTDYILQVSAKGATVEASVYKTNASGAKGEELGTARTDDATDIKPGYIGLRGAYGNSGPVGTWFHSFHLTTED